MSNTKFSRLLDLEEIRNLRIKYGHFLDSRHLDEVAGLFAPQALCDAGQGLWHGRDAIRAGLAAAFEAYDTHHHGSYPFLHAVTNQWVELTGDDTAEGRCYLIDLHAASPFPRDPWLLLGMYADAYRRIEGRWYISRSRLDIAWPQRALAGGLPGRGLVLPDAHD